MTSWASSSGCSSHCPATAFPSAGYALNDGCLHLVVIDAMGYGFDVE